MRHARTVLGLSLASCLAAAAPGVARAADPKPADDRSFGEKIRDRIEAAKEKLAGDDAQANRDPVRAAQTALRERGYDAGEPDGRMGAKTRAAVRAFQKDERLPVTGRLDAKTMERLQAGRHESRPSASPSTERRDSTRR